MRHSIWSCAYRLKDVAPVVSAFADAKPFHLPCLCGPYQIPFTHVLVFLSCLDSHICWLTASVALTGSLGPTVFDSPLNTAPPQPDWSNILLLRTTAPQKATISRSTQLGVSIPLPSVHVS